MPTVVTEGRYRFVVHTRENDFEPPHVHVFVGNEDVCRIDLVTGRLMDAPPPGDHRAIAQSYGRHQEAIRKVWDEIHGK